MPIRFKMPEKKTNLPDDTQRIVIVGTTGSGKTHAGMWHLGMRNYHEKPWVVYDWKRDDLINSIDGSIELNVRAPAPENPGLYIVHPILGDDDDAVAAQMKDIWEKEDIGVFVDECYMVAKNNGAFRNLLTQGRSKHIPMIICTQRPVWVDKFVFTESEFKQLFRLQSVDDQDKMKEYIPAEAIESINRMYPLRGKEMKYWSHYYDAPDDDIQPMHPVPDAMVIRSMFNAKLARMRRAL